MKIIDLKNIFLMKNPVHMEQIFPVDLGGEGGGGGEWNSFSMRLLIIPQLYNILFDTYNS